MSCDIKYKEEVDRNSLFHQQVSQADRLAPTHEGKAFSVRMDRGDSISPGLSANSDDAYDLSTPATRKRRHFEQRTPSTSPSLIENTPTIPTTPLATRLTTPISPSSTSSSSSSCLPPNYPRIQAPQQYTTIPPVTPSHAMPGLNMFPYSPNNGTSPSSCDTITPMETFLRNAQMVQRYRELTLHLAEMTRRALQQENNCHHENKQIEHRSVYETGLPCLPSPVTPYQEEPLAYPLTPTRYHSHNVEMSVAKKGEGEGPRRKLGVTSKDGRRFTCDRCPKSYSTVGALKMHVRTHTLPCRCTVCGKAFSRPWLLQGHMRTHTGEKPFSCDHCQRAFADRSNLRAHLQTHSAVKRYRCTSCQKTFSRMSLLLKHQTTCSYILSKNRETIAKPIKLF